MGRLVCAFAMFFSALAFGKGPIPSFDGYINVGDGISIYAKVTKGDPEAPVFVLLNGLTQDSDHWKTAVPYLQEKKATVVLLDLALQGRSLIKRLDENVSVVRPVVKPLIMKGGAWDLPPVIPEVTIEQQSAYVMETLRQLGFDRPVTLLGLSYGGGLALQIAADYPDRVKPPILVAPYAFPLPDLDKLINEGVAAAKLNPAYLGVADDILYDVILRAVVLMTYPSAEPEINKWRPPNQTIGAGELVRGIRHMDYQALFAKVRVPLHLVVAGKDSYIPRKNLDEFWARVPRAYRGSFLEVQGVEHKVNESVGPFLASWAWELATNDDLLRHPGQFLGVPQNGVATEIGGTRVIPLKGAVPCEDWLAATPLKVPGDRIQRSWLAKGYQTLMSFVGREH